MINEQDDLKNYSKYCRIESLNLCFYSKNLLNKETSPEKLDLNVTLYFLVKSNLLMNGPQDKYSL